MATVTLTWTPAGGANSTNQRIYRGLDLTVSTLLATVSPSVGTYIDSTAPNGATVYYKVDNICNNGGPTASPVVSITTPGGGDGGSTDPVEYFDVGWGGDTGAACSMAIIGGNVLYTTCRINEFGSGCQLYIDGSMSERLLGFTHLFANSMNWLITTGGVVIGPDDNQC